MTFARVLIPFTEHVAGRGMVVGNAGAVVDLPIQYARQRRARGYVEYDDADAEEEAVADAARPRSRKERRLLARAERRAANQLTTDAPEAPLRPVAARTRPASKPSPRRGKSAAKPAAKRSSASKASAATTRKATGKKPGNPELSAARADYKVLTGKNPSPRLDAAGIRAKIDEAKAAGAQPGVKSDAPVE